MKIFQALEKAEALLKKEGLSTPRLDTEVLLCHTIGEDKNYLYKNPEKFLNDNEVDLFQALVERRREKEPVAYIVGNKEFWSLDLEVTRGVLIPRPDTEALVEEALRISHELNRENLKILDVGTGSGAIAIALASQLENSAIVAVDSSMEALMIARRNAEKYELGERILFLCGNLLKPLSGKFDIVVSNPPYVSESEFERLPDEIRKFEPKGALVSGRDGTECHRDLIGDAKYLLEGGGWLVMEIGWEQAEAIEQILRNDGSYGDVLFHRDLGGRKRVVSARIDG
ncbi:MAG: peptide chain release factor N(5)-glutamine methyltransferase [Deltaproteobacteria bacterium]|nr:peptide chain release factor N(5)-glutamine methyltransferase [Deltaproteobacteria bacterium]